MYKLYLQFCIYKLISKEAREYLNIIISIINYLSTHASNMNVGLFILFISCPGGVLLNSSTPIVCKAVKSVK